MVRAVLRALPARLGAECGLVIHSEEGLLAILFIFSIHFVNTHLRPDSFPMDMVIFTGGESEEEFKRSRPDEYQRMSAEGKLRRGSRCASVLVDKFQPGGRLYRYIDWPDSPRLDADRLFRWVRGSAMSQWQRLKEDWLQPFFSTATILSASSVAP